MNKPLTLFCTLVAALLPLTLHAQIQGLYKIDKIAPNFINTPEYQIGTSIHQEPNPVGKWLEIEVQFESQVEFTDELTVKYYVLVTGGTAQTLLSGDVTHVNVPKGHELFSVMYVSPRTLTRLLGPNVPATANAIRDIGVQLLVKGQVVYETSTIKTGVAAEWWQNMQQTPGLMLNKNQTPFAPLFWDRYEAIKPAGQ